DRKEPRRCEEELKDLANRSSHQLEKLSQTGSRLKGHHLVMYGLGTISATIAGQAAPQTLGNFQLVDFVNPSGLQPRGENLLLETAASGTPNSGTPGNNGLGLLAQGSLESSNVNVVEELVNMIETQRAYEMNSKAIQTNDQMLQYVNNNL
ncbi:MAG: flagellar hook-basal body complex protein, partial [Pseudomonadota bacterium]